MLTDIFTIAWKESKEFVQGSSRVSTVGRLVFPIALAGIFMPWRAGRAYLAGPLALVSLAWILPMIAVSFTVDSVAGERERNTLESLLATRLPDQAVLFGKLAASVAYAWGMVLASLALAAVTVNLRQGNGPFVFYSAAYGTTLVVISFLGSILVCGAAVLVSVRAPTVRQAAQTFAYASSAVVFAIIFGRQAMPATWRLWLREMLTGPYRLQIEIAALLLFVAVDVAVLAVARHRFQRARLILD